MYGEVNFEKLRVRQSTDGGFPVHAGDGSRVDATAWAVLALAPVPNTADAVAGARRFLASRQADDGSVPILIEAPRAIWPTPLAVLAWAGDDRFSDPLRRAADYLSATTGLHWKRQPDDPVSHDTSIRGWPWVLDTHSWVGSTSLAILAMEAAGRGSHERVTEAVAMLADRQLPDGGWNYGNVSVFGQTLEPLQEATGMALRAVRGRLGRDRVEKSLAYLQSTARRLRTPLSLSWALMGLDAWGIRPEPARTWIEETLALQETVGEYDSAQLATLLVAAHTLEETT